MERSVFKSLKGNVNLNKYIYIYIYNSVRNYQKTPRIHYKDQNLILLKEIIAMHCEDTLWAKIKSFLLRKKWYIWLPVCFEWLNFKKKSEHILKYEQTSRFPIQLALTHADNDFIMSCLQRQQNKSKLRSSFLISLIHILHRNSGKF